MSRRIEVYLDEAGRGGPQRIGLLRSDVIRGREHFRFAYDPDWLRSPQAWQIDPELALYPGDQHSQDAETFRVFLDSCPDRWGRLLMRRREALRAQACGERPRRLLESDFLLGVHDTYRLGALRFKREGSGVFLDDDPRQAAPPLARLGELQEAAQALEAGAEADAAQINRWLAQLLAPGSSLGGARPKASVVDEHQALWIAKFPSRQDTHDVGLWELLCQRLAQQSGIGMSESRPLRLAGPYHTFLTRRFDRDGGARVHFASALTLLQRNDGDSEAGYLDLARFVRENVREAREDLAQLWRRLVFNIAVSNADDHLRNHGFVLREGRWRLSPAFDVNPDPLAQGLHLNISETDNRLDFDLALEVAELFELERSQAESICDAVLAQVETWADVADSLGIPRSEQHQMAGAFAVGAPPGGRGRPRAR